jgi:hypothetical protein
MVDLKRDPRLKRRIEPATDSDVRLGTPEALTQAPPSCVTGTRVNALAKEGITFQSGEHPAQAAQVMATSASVVQKQVKFIRLLEARVDAIDLAMNEGTATRETVLGHLQIELEDWAYLESWLPYIDVPERRQLAAHIRDAKLRLRKMVSRAKRIPANMHIRTANEAKREAENYPRYGHPSRARSCSPQPMPVPTPAPTPKNLHVRMSLASQVAIYTPGHCANSDEDTLYLEKRHLWSVPERDMLDVPDFQPGEVCWMVGIIWGPVFIGDPHLEESYIEWNKQYTCVLTKVSPPYAVLATGDVVVNGSLTIDACLGASMGDQSVESVGSPMDLLEDMATVQPAPTTAKRKHVDDGWIHYRSYESIDKRMKLEQYEKMNEGTGSTEPEVNAIVAEAEVALERLVVSAPAPTEPVPKDDEVPTEAAVSVPAVSEPAPAAEVQIESEVPQFSSPVVFEHVTIRIRDHRSPEWYQQDYEHRQAHKRAYSTPPMPTEEVLGAPAVTEPAPTKSSPAEHKETEEDWMKVPGAYPRTPEESVLPRAGSSETVESEPAVPQPAPAVPEMVVEESSSKEVESVGNNATVAGEEEEQPDPWAFPPQRPRRVGGFSHLERILALAPVSREDSDVQTEEQGIETPSPTSTLTEGINSRAGESPEKESESAHAALPIAEEQRASLEVSIAASSGPSLPEVRPTSSPAVNASDEYDVRSLGSGLLRSMASEMRYVGFIVLAALVTLICAFVYLGRHSDTFAEVMAAPDRVLEELRNSHGLDIEVFSRIVYELLRWLAGDRVLPG